MYIVHFCIEVYLIMLKIDIRSKSMRQFVFYRVSRLSSCIIEYFTKIFREILVYRV